MKGTYKGFEIEANNDGNVVQGSVICEKSNYVLAEGLQSSDCSLRVVYNDLKRAVDERGHQECCDLEKEVS